MRAATPVALAGLATAALLLSACAANQRASTPASTPAASSQAAAGNAARTAAAKPINCVQLQNIRETRVVDDKTIDFYMRDGTVLRNNLPGSCAQLGFERAFSYSTSISQLCNVDIISVIQQSAGIRRGASCGLGMFTPYTPPAK